jgi:NAD(P)-dependent dehydrogenase (short-subunit alcohol dehydrogenase family)
VPGHEPDTSGDAVTVVHADVTDDTALADLLERMGDVDVRVNCAGIALEDGSEHTPDGWDRVLRVNLTAAMRLSTFARPRMAGRAASIVNIASMYSTFGSSLIPAYAASKGALVQLTKSLAQAYGPTVSGSTL